MKKQQKKKQTAGIRKILKLKPTCFSAMALLILLVLAFQVWHRDENPLLKKNNSITLYREVYEGQMPEFRTEVFFPNNHFDYEKVTYIPRRWTSTRRASIRFRCCTTAKPPTAWWR